MMEKVAVAQGSDDWCRHSIKLTNHLLHPLWQCKWAQGAPSFHFEEQIASGADITITDPNMTRFMMTLSHAVD